MNAEVSILVLMELPLQPKDIAKLREELKGFNPCFNGTTSATYLEKLANSQRNCFNPCFNGTTSATPGIYEVMLGFRKFQSLF
mgnify:CR=1 FL=1